MANISISQMNTRAEANLSDLHEVAYVDTNSNTGYASGKMTMEVMANAIVNDFAYQSLGNKTVKGAIEDAEVTVDTALDTSSNNPIANSPVATAITGIESNTDGIQTTTTQGQILTMDSAGIYADDVSVDIEPIQDLHGYDYPWVGGAGKNLLPMTVEGIKSLNTSGTWNGNVYTHNGVTFELLTDSASNITGIKVNGTANGNSVLIITPRFTMTNGTYILSTNVQENTYRCILEAYNNYTWVRNIALVSTSDVTFTIDNSNYNYLNAFISIASGDTITNATFYPMIRLSTVTDPTFAPYSNICPISGYDSVSVTRTGVNQWDEEWESGYYNANGEFVAGTNVASKNLIPCVGNTTYYFYGGTNANSQYRLCFYDINQDFIERTADSYVGTSFTTPINAHYMTFYMELTPYGTTYNNDISINYPSTITSYVPYNGRSITTTFNDTVYSGTLDVTTGILTVDKAMVDLGTLTWSYGNNTFYTDQIYPITYLGKYNKIICSDYKTVYVEHASEMTNGDIRCYNQRSYVKDDRYTDATTFKNAMDGVQLVYELATPQVYNLTPQQLQMLKGYNTVTTDANGGMTIKYQPNNVVGECKEYAQRLYDLIVAQLS